MIAKINFTSINDCIPVSFKSKIVVLFIFLTLGITTVKAQHTVYVSHTTHAAGDGSMALPYNLSELFANVIGQVPADNVVNIFFEKGGTYHTGPFASGNNFGFSISNWGGKIVTLDVWGNGTPVVFDGNMQNSSFIQITRRRTSNAWFTLNIKNIIFRNFSKEDSTPFIAVTDNYNIINIESITVQNCNNTQGHLFHIDNSRTTFTLSNSSIINNNRGNKNLIYLQNVESSDIYNNTFSANTTTEHGINIDTRNVHFFNNTLYNSGTLHIHASSTPRSIINNLVAGTSVITFRSTGEEFRAGLRNNVSGTEFWKTGSTVLYAFTKARFENHFNITLTNNNNPGGQFHDLKNISDKEHLFLEKGISASDLAQDINNNVMLETDQTGRKRPAQHPISLGAVDYRNFVLSPSPVIHILFNSMEGTKLPSPKEIDLKTLVLETPEGTDLSQAKFEFVTRGMKYGTLSNITSDKKTTFSPAIQAGKPTGVGLVDTFHYKVSRIINGISFEKTAMVRVLIVNTYEPSGHIDPANYPNTCFDFMGKITFSGQHRFMTTESHRLVGYSIPLVADLNKDGYPEIIAFSKRSNSSHDHYEFVHIFNGQTGEHICALRIAPNDFTHYGWHPSPSPAVLVDANRDGIVELIMAFPSGGGGDSPYKGKVVSFDIKPTGATYELIHNKTFPVSYGEGLDSNASIATPQICDLDGDGTPELLVYDKVYNAVSGELLFTIDPDYMGRNPNAWYSGDRFQAFPYIYDVDGDGIYDIAAGGRLYKITKPGGVWDVKEITLDGNDNPGDGFTGVADINGDGLPDIVTVRMITRASAGNILVTVWNPGFSNGVAHPHLLAQKTVTITYRTGSEGSNSYVYIGDINGVEYGGGKRLPEIAVLSGRVRFTDDEVHPDISGLTGKDTRGAGAIFALTFDENETDITKKLKFSFFLEHQDTSDDTGFTMFDFDNDGIMEICYRDKETLRIIKPTKSYVTLDETDSNVILFKAPVFSGTGFEYPVIADIDNDASAEMIVMGHPRSGDFYGYVYALGSKGDKFAPARPVWNQFVYDPFKINDDLTTPVGPAKNRLTYKYKHEVRNNDGTISKTINNYQPYNATINQTPYFTTLSNGTGQLSSFEAIIFLTESYIVAENAREEAKRPKIVIEGNNAFIEVTIGNKATAKTDISINTPVAVYENQISASTLLKKESLTALGVTSAIKAGEDKRIRIPVDNPYSVYYVRLGDDSGYDGPGDTNQVWRFGTNNEGEGAGTNVSNPPADPAKGIGKARRAFRDCDWTDQSVKVSMISLNHDAVTVQEYGSVRIDIFQNDEIHVTDAANPFPSLKPGFKMGKQYIRGKGPTAGALTFSGGNIIYTHNGTIPPGNIDTFSYAFNYKPTGSGTEKEFFANVYVYIMQPATGSLGVCYGDDFTARLKESPKGIRFIWWDEKNQYQTSSDSLTIPFGVITTPETYTVKPLLSVWNNDRIEFLPGQLTVSPLGASGSGGLMKWTGVTDTNWHDPRNWVEIKNGTETAALSIPANCSDILIPSGLKNYPILTSAVSCAKITLQNRAMIAGIHRLTYTEARVELKPEPAERDRFIMWSAPLMNMYSGDYHFRKGNAPYWGDVFMNFFQAKNPDDPSSVAKGNYFTPTFKNPGFELAPGQSFNLKLIATSSNKDSLFVFPKTEKSYTATDAVSYQTPRNARAGRFMSDTVIAAGNRIPVTGALPGSNYIQVVNPFMAWLSIRNFLDNNNKLENAVRIWNGAVSSQPDAASGDFITVLPDKADGNRYIIDNAEDWFKNGTDSTGYIAPLQSFFVRKKNQGETVTHLNMDPAWTTTAASPRSGGYTLRADTKETRTLRIRAVQHAGSDATVLYYHPEATPDYDDEKDACKLFSSETAVSVYSFSPANEPLAIHASNDFGSAAIRLGIRLKEAGPVTLHFSGMEYARKVYLIDHAQNNKKTDVQQNPSYTFTAVKQSPDDEVTELNDRFSLEIHYTGTLNETIRTKNVSVTAKDGYICVQTPRPAESIQVYTTAGALVYATRTRSDNYRIQAESSNTYIIKVTMNGEYVTEKVFVR